MPQKRGLAWGWTGISPVRLQETQRWGRMRSVGSNERCGWPIVSAA